MAKLEHLLVASDGSEGALKAARFAGDLARALGARVTVLVVHNADVILPYAWGPGEWPAAAPYGTMSIDEIQTMIEGRAAENEVPATVAALGTLAAPATTAQRWGHAAEEICRYAVDHTVDLVVIGSHGRSGLGRLLLGSISNQVANHATCPVTIVR